MDNKKLPKTPKLFSCKKCNYICFHKNDYNKHLSTRKHLRNKNRIMIKSQPIVLSIHVVIVNKKYKYKSGLSKHKSNCINTSLESGNIQVLTELVKELVNTNCNIVKQNQELHKKFIELTTTTEIHTTIHNTTNNTNTQNLTSMYF